MDAAELTAKYERAVAALNVALAWLDGRAPGTPEERAAELDSCRAVLDDAAHDDTLGQSVIRIASQAAHLWTWYQDTIAMKRRIYATVPDGDEPQWFDTDGSNDEGKLYARYVEHLAGQHAAVASAWAAARRVGRDALVGVAGPILDLRVAAPALTAALDALLPTTTNEETTG